MQNGKIIGKPNGVPRNRQLKSPQLVSVLINNYNKEKYCLNAVKSVLNQTYKNLEVIFYDDNSNDNSVKKNKEIKTDKLTIILNKKRSKNFLIIK